VLLEGADQLRLQSKPLDGQQVEPALTEPVNVRGHKARQSNWELAREAHQGPASQSGVQQLETGYT
jgi:hypothetical protein